MGAAWLVWAGLGASAPAVAATTGSTGETGDTGAAPTGATGETGDTGAGPTAPDTGPDPDVDLDGDGFTPAEGDCDETERDVHPGVPEVCGDQLDNDCDGLFDGGCDDAVRLATLRGGGGCTGGAGVAGTQGWIVLLPVPLLFGGRWAFARSRSASTPSSGRRWSCWS